jgi:hypothetical protein
MRANGLHGHVAPGLSKSHLFLRDHPYKFCAVPCRGIGPSESHPCDAVGDHSRGRHGKFHGFYRERFGLPDASTCHMDRALDGG